jgi:hypothetical protein
MRTSTDKERRSISCMSDVRLRWIKPLVVVVERSEGRVALWSQHLQEWGVGENFALAADDMARAVAEQYWVLMGIAEPHLTLRLQHLKRNYLLHLGTRD